MKGIIFYFSTTGNTLNVCKCIKRKVNNTSFELADIKNGEIPDISGYDVVGFATYTDYWGPPMLMQRFIQNIPKCSEKYAFVVNTHSGESGKTLMIMGDWIKTKGFRVIASASLSAPVNFPPAIAEGWSNEQDPSQEELDEFTKAIEALNDKLKLIGDNHEVGEEKIIISEKNMSLAYATRAAAKDEMGNIFVDNDLCNKCGKCERICGYKAVMLNPNPVFDQQKCYGCWACFNNCPTKAIYTEQIRGIGQYKSVSKRFLEKLAKI
jgi:ferredoxin